MRAGLRVVLAGSGSPRRITRAAEMFAPNAEAAWAADAVAQAQLVVLAMPLSAALDDVDANLLDGKIVIDATNYWPESDGRMPELESVPTSTLVQRHFHGATVVKSLNHMAFRDLEQHAAPAVPTIGVGVAGGAGADAVSRFVRELGFVPIVVGTLTDSGVLGPQSAVFGAVLTPEKFRQRLAEGGWTAKR